MASEITYENGRKVYTSSKTLQEETSSVSFSVALGDEEIGGSAVPTTSSSEKMSLSDFTASEIERVKEKLLNQHLYELDNEVIVPSVSSSPLLSQMKVANDIRKQNQERDILMANVDKEYKKTDIQVKLKQVELQKEQNTQTDGILVMMGEQYVQNEHILNTLGGLRSSLGAMIKTLNSMLENQTNTNEKIVENITKKNEHLDFLKDGHPELKDSGGNIIKPLEIEAKNNAEQQIYKHAQNTTNWHDLINDVLENINQGGVGLGLNIEEESQLEQLLNKLISFDSSKFETELNQNLFKRD